AIFVTKVFWDIPGGTGPHWNRDWPYVGFHAANPRPVGCDTDKRTFIGRNGRLSEPEALQTGRSADTANRWVDPIGSLQIELTIKPGETAEVVFSLGAVDTAEEAATIIQRYSTPDAVRDCLQETRALWLDIVDGLKVETPDPAFNLMGNVWLKYQA